MSGEQAEERTAREGRMDKEALRKKLEAMKPWSVSLTVPGNTFTTYTISMCRCGLNKDVDDEQCGRCNQLELLSECSRLASRVGELEAGLMEAIKLIRIWHGSPGWEIYRDCSPEMKAIWKALAGAHAEEKE